MVNSTIRTAFLWAELNLSLTPQEIDDRIQQAAELIRSADALLIGAGAGMGVDSGLPDFRGNEGFWKAYPPFRGRIFAEMSNPTWFERDPELAWGFFGHRMNLYRDAVPHIGFEILKRWSERMPLGSFIFTSNVDGQFQKAGFDSQRLQECHGSIHRLQCSRPCSSKIWPAGELRHDINPETVRTSSPLPICPQCGAVARPNILMFGDGGWISTTTDEQSDRFANWLSTARQGSIVAVECGAGLAIPSVRKVCERVAPRLIRINPRDYWTASNGIGIPLGAAEALQRIDDRWSQA